MAKYRVNPHTGKPDAIGSSMTVSAVQPSGSTGDWWYNTADRGLYFFAEGVWNLLHTITAQQSVVYNTDGEVIYNTDGEQITVE